MDTASVVSFGRAATQILTTIAPTIATAIGGPVAGIAVAKLETFFGVKGVGAVETALQAATPDQLAALKKIDDDFKVEMAQIGFDEQKLAFDDTASARARETIVKDHTPAILAYGISVGFFAILSYLLAYGKPAVGGDVILVMLGALGTSWTTIVAYYFGSSAGSVAKDKTLSEIAKS
jgi:hypothetical protein